MWNSYSEERQKSIEELKLVPINYVQIKFSIKKDNKLFVN